MLKIEVKEANSYEIAKSKVIKLDRLGKNRPHWFLLISISILEMYKVIFHVG